ncbi:NAD(P)H-hydrate dehydratase [Paraglaciecola sp.]|uniref:NAD(P)H-hydrate dehydratase n=1 Tax=Paraglaciecola sp. TaxID=1920173 RepID=UPI003263BB7A
MTLPNLLNNKSAASLAHNIVCAEQVRRFESEAAMVVGCSLYQLMERAGEAAFDVLDSHWPNTKNILVIAGNGNNAGDGYVVASLALSKGAQVIVACEDPIRVLGGDAQRAKSEWLAAGGELVSFADMEFEGVDLVVDALLGTGVAGPVKESFQNIILAINDKNLPVLSLDLPSGMNADTGTPLPVCINADITITFVAIKAGLVTGKAKSLCGILKFNDLGIGPSFFELATLQGKTVNWSRLQPLTPRLPHANKGHFGKLLCIGGNVGMPGAIRLSAEAALRTGTGLVKVFCHESSAALIGATRPELMVTISDLQEALDWCTSIIIGPGLGRDTWATKQFQAVIAHLEQQHKPLVIDADGLNLLALSDEYTKNVVRELPHCILTPHPGEACRLLNQSIKDVEADRYASCQTLALSFKATSLLKGAGTVICTDSHKVDNRQMFWVCDGGNPGMATAGMGDLLTGIIGSFSAQGIPPQQATIYGVCAHAEAADKVAREYGERGMIASDLLPALRATINSL